MKTYKISVGFFKVYEVLSADYPYALVEARSRAIEDFDEFASYFKE